MLEGIADRKKFGSWGQSMAAKGVSEKVRERPDFREERGEDGSTIDMEIEDNAPDISDPFDPKEIDIKSRPYLVEQCIKRLQHGEITLTPDFQRNASIWKAGQKSRLIESLLLRIPVPVFYIATDENDNWLVVDGLQRLSTLKEFILDKTLVLRDMEFLKQYEGEGFDGLPRNMQRRLNEAELLMHVIQPGTPRFVTRTIFKRINTGGLPLSAQEIRHALYLGKSTDLLKDLVAEEAYIQTTEGRLRDDRMLGRECALRFMAFHIFTPDSYTKKDMDGFLCRAMEEINGMRPAKIARLREVFITAMERCAVIFGPYAFRKQYEPEGWRYPINKALFETWTYSLASLSADEFDIARRRRKRINAYFISMMNGEYFPPGVANDMNFELSISQETSDPWKVRFRFAVVMGLLRHVVED